LGDGSAEEAFPKRFEVVVKLELGERKEWQQQDGKYKKVGHKPHVAPGEGTVGIGHEVVDRRVELGEARTDFALLEPFKVYLDGRYEKHGKGQGQEEPHKAFADKLEDGALFEREPHAHPRDEKDEWQAPLVEPHDDAVDEYGRSVVFYFPIEAGEGDGAMEKDEDGKGQYPNPIDVMQALVHKNRLVV